MTILTIASMTKPIQPSFKNIDFPKQWIAGGVMDAEYKEYVLLAWLQKLKNEFKNTRLYPALGDIIQKHHELKQIQSELTSSHEAGPLKSLDLRNLRLLRQSNPHQDQLESYLDALIQRALPHLSSAMDEGKALYDLVASQLQFVSVGVQPIRVAEGYLLVTQGRPNKRQLKAYRYTKSRVIQNDDAFLELRLQCVESRPISRLEQAENVKWSLIKRHKDLPQPATYHVHLDWNIPINQTLLPIARRKLLQEISKDGVT